MTGRFYYGANQAELLTILPYNDDAAKLKSLTDRFHGGVITLPGITVELETYTTYQKYTEYDAVAQEVAARLTPNGYAADVASCLTPRSLFTGAANQAKLIDATLTGLD